VCFNKSVRFQDAEQGIFPEEEQFSDFEEIDTAALERDAVSRLMKTANSVKKLSKRKRRLVDRESSDDEAVNDDDEGKKFVLYKILKN